MLSPPPPPMLVNELVIFGQTLQFPPDLVIIGKKKKTFRLNLKKEKIGTICLIVLFCLNWSYFVSFGQICLFQSYFAHIMCHLWYLFSWSIILFNWSVIHQIGKVGQNY